MSPAWLLLLLPGIAFSQYEEEGEDTGLFVENVSGNHGVEYYDDDGIRYAIFLEHVAWHEAMNLCPANNGSLIVFKSEAMAEFIGRALAESAVGYSSLWVGGEYVLNPTNGIEGEWKWISGDTISTNFEDNEEFPMKASPFWLDKPTVAADRPYCLATDRKMHHLPIIFPLPCDMQRPYICALPLPGSTEQPTEVKPPVKEGGKTFHLFVAHVTWAEALMQCRGMGMKLAVVTREEEFKILGQRMLRSRPVMENAWISGMFTKGKWMWVSSNEPINVNKSAEVPGEPFAWYRPDNIVMDGCLLADRHLCDHFVYVEARCDRRRNYICEEDQKNTTLPPIIPVTPFPGWWMSTIEVTWFVAQNICRSCLDGSLVELNATKEGIATVLPILYAAMALTLRVEVRHLWVGGYLVNEKFKWISDPNAQTDDRNEITADKFEKLNDPSVNGEISFCAADFKKEKYLLSYKCLNLDRENQKSYFMYGLACDMKQHFICKADGAKKPDDKCWVRMDQNDYRPRMTEKTSASP